MSADSTVTPLVITHHSEVTEDQIDHLGHMNVRFYGANARAASALVIERLELGDQVGLRAVDFYTRHHNEQLLGAELNVSSGVLGATSTTLHLYHELANATTGSLAATFVHRLEVNETTGSPSTVATETVNRVNAAAIEIPAHGATRSISLDIDPAAAAPSLHELRRRGLAMQREREIRASECDKDGTVLAESIPSLMWEGEPVSDADDHWPLTDGPDGEKMGWASMETRMTLARSGRAGNMIQGFGALVEVGDKVTQAVHWVYDVGSDQLLAVFQGVNLAFDTVGRRSMVIPDAARAREESRCHRDLAPRSVDSAIE
jgi:acyl-CoA thioesterase FadM